MTGAQIYALRALAVDVAEQMPRDPAAAQATLDRLLAALDDADREVDEHAALARVDRCGRGRVVQRRDVGGRTR